MENGEKNFEYTAYAEPAVIADYLENLARHLRGGHVSLAAGTDSIQLDLGPNVKMEVAARVKPDKGKGSVQMDISWKRPPHFEDSLRIEAGEEKSESEGGEQPNLEIATG